MNRIIIKIVEAIRESLKKGIERDLTELAREKFEGKQIRRIDAYPNALKTSILCLYTSHWMSSVKGGYYDGKKDQFLVVSEDLEDGRMIAMTIWEKGKWVIEVISEQRRRGERIGTELNCN